MNASAKQDIASQIIAKQIGNRALFMFGARNLMAGDRRLTFKVAQNAHRVTHVVVTLDPTDTYRVEFVRIVGRKVTTLATRSDIYSDALADTISAGTGLNHSL